MQTMPKYINRRIIPAFLVHSKKEFCQRLGVLETLNFKPKLIQIDVCDGLFVDNTTWPTTASSFKNIDISVPFEVHLMVQHPEKVFKKWIDAGASRVVFHREATIDSFSLITAIKTAGAKPIMAINPDTKIDQNPLIFKQIYGILVMGVYPGFGGQKQLPNTIRKVRALRKQYPRLRIGVDGGVTSRNASTLIEAGATELVMGSSLFSL